jgi:O-antigen/teichoic acid export membrane protein
MSEINQKLAKNTLIQLIGKGLGTALSLITFIFLLRYLHTAGLGALSVALTYGSIFAIIVDFGLTLTTAQMIAQPQADENRILSGILTLRVLSAFIFLSFGALLVFNFPYTQEIKLAAVISCASFFFGSIASMFAGVFQKRLAVHYVVLAETLNRTIVFIFAALLPLLQPSIIIASTIFVAGSLTQLFITFYAVLKFSRVRPRFDLTIWKAAFIQTWPIGISAAFNLIYLKGDIFFMSILHVSHRDIGLYAAAYKFVDVVTTVPVMFMGLMLPLLTLAWANNNKSDFRNHLQRGFDGLVILAVPYAFGAIALGGPLLALIDPDLISGGKVLALLGPATAAVFISSLFGHTVVAIHKQRPMILGYLAVAVLATIGYIYGINHYGMIAAAWVTLGSEALIATITTIVVLATTKIKLSLKHLIAALLASVVMYLAIKFIPLPHVTLSIIAGVIIYLITLPLFGGPSPKQLLKLVSPSKL